jgi:hypothetical protein
MIKAINLMISIILLVIFSITTITYALLHYVRINSSGYIAVISFPSGKLHIGNASRGENPCFFYDENGQIVTLCMIQAAATEPFFTFRFPETQHTYAEEQIELVNKSAANTHRLHLFFVSGEGNEYSSFRRVPNQDLYKKLIDFCRKAAARGQYYVLDGYIDNTTITVNTSNWFFRELTSPGGLLWNETVMDDFVWIWNETLWQLKSAGADVWNHLVYIDVWSEFDGGTPEDVKSMCRNPYLYDGKHGSGNAALVSWQNWLRKKYDNNIEKLKNTWNLGTTEKWNWNGKETDSFDSLQFSQGALATESMRQVDMQLWYNEVILNFTRYCTEQWKKSFPDVYVCWGGYGADVSMGFAGSISPSEPSFNLVALLFSTDVIDQHWYGSDGEQDFTHWDSDYVKYGLAQLAAAGRALKKPIVLGETGCVAGQGIGFSEEERENTYTFWNRTLMDLMRFGWAGWCPYWYGYYYHLEAAPNAITETNIRLSVMKRLNELYAAHQHEIAQNRYDPICIISTYGEKMREHRGLEGIFQLFINVGYNPKYVVLEWNETKNLPDEIPEDTSVVVIGSGYTSFAMSEYTGRLIREWGNNNESRKIIALYCQERSIHNISIHWEDTLNASWFPLQPMIYGVTYISSDFAHNSTNIHVNLYGEKILIDRSADWYSGYYVNWSYTNIKGIWLINTTDGRFYNGIGYEPLVIANNKLAWIMSPLDKTCACLNTFRMLSPNSGLIIRRIMEHFGFSPIS